MLLLDMHLIFVACLNFLQLAYNVLLNKDSLVNNQLCNHPLDHLQSFECYHILIDHLLLVDQKGFVNQ